MEPDKRVLSIQSHVVHGYVGNKSASFPLQVLGFEVDQINSVQFSNHKGYASCTGGVLNADQLSELYQGLQANNLTRYTHLLTGFVGEKSFLEKIAELVADLKQRNPGLVYVCDPVMGDHGKMYVPEELLPVYRDTIVPLADIITPNQFEAELLTGMRITGVASARAAIARLHEMGTKTVVITSSNLGSDGELVALAASVSNGYRTGLRIDIPLLPTVFTGTGDLFAALLLAWLHTLQLNLQEAIERTVATMQSVLHRTLTHAQGLVGAGGEPGRAELELRLVQSRSDIENPTIKVRAQRLEAE